jgi:hypothetical protein
VKLWVTLHRIEGFNDMRVGESIDCFTTEKVA